MARPVWHLATVHKWRQFWLFGMTNEEALTIHQSLYPECKELIPVPKVIVNPDGPADDITQSVAVLYEMMRRSLDWGSGFLSVEEAEHVLRIGTLCGFETVQEAADQMEAFKKQAERDEENAKRMEAYKIEREIYLTEKFGPYKHMLPNA